MFEQLKKALKMDLLGSILDSMDKPPEIDDKRKEQMKSIKYFVRFNNNF